jgi:Cys-rich repeat protein
MTRPKCNTTYDFCVQCVTNMDCPDGGTCGAMGICGP